MSVPDPDALIAYFRQMMLIPDIGDSRREKLEKFIRKNNLDPKVAQALMIDVFLKYLELCANGFQPGFIKNGVVKGILHEISTNDMVKLCARDPLLQQIATQTEGSLLLIEKIDDPIEIRFLNKPQGTFEF
jgi:hypothetical protein